MHRSTLYDQIAERVRTEYTVPPTAAWSRHWFNNIAPRWRARVGIPRLTAEVALIEASALVRSINRRVFPAGTAQREAYDTALDAIAEVAALVARENWRRFETPPSEARGGEANA